MKLSLTSEDLVATCEAMSYAAVTLAGTAPTLVGIQTFSIMTTICRDYMCVILASHLTESADAVIRKPDADLVRFRNLCAYFTQRPLTNSEMNEVMEISERVAQRARALLTQLEEELGAGGPL